MNYKSVIFVFLGGGTGSLIRYFTGIAVKNVLTLSFPLSTLLVNAASVLILLSTFTFAYLKEYNQDNIKSLLVIGFCGGLSTFSTFSAETAELFRRGDTIWAILNIVLNNLLCIGILFLWYKR